MKVYNDMSRDLREFLGALDLTGELDEAQVLLMEKIYEDLDNGIKGVIYTIKESQADISGLKGSKNFLKDEMDRLDAKIKVKQKNIDWYMFNLDNVMTDLGVEEKDFGDVRLKYDKKAGVPNYDDLDVETLPKKYVSIKKSIDKTTLKEDLKKGIKVKDAKMLPGGKTLKIK